MRPTLTRMSWCGVTARKQQSQYLQVEAYIPGREFAVEGIVTRGAPRILAIFDKPDPLEGPFFEETIYVTPSRESAAAQQSMRETVAVSVPVSRAVSRRAAFQRERHLDGGGGGAAHWRALLESATLRRGHAAGGTGAEIGRASCTGKG